MLYDPQDFLHSLATWAANRCTGTLVGGTQYGAIAPPCPIAYNPNFGSAPFNLFLNRADENAINGDPGAADPYAVLRIYGGKKERSNPTPTISVQLHVTAKARQSGWFLAGSLYRGLCLNNQEQELRTVVIPGLKVTDNSEDGTWVLVSAKTTNTPGQIAEDGRGRISIVSNFDLAFYKAS